MRAKRILAAGLLLATLSGCAGNRNTITTTYQDGRVEVREMSDDGVYYQEAAKALGAVEASVCSNCTPGELIALRSYRAIEVVSGKAFVDRGMNGYELTAKVSGDIKDGLPAIGLLSATRYLAKRPNSVQFNGDGNSYIASEVFGNQNTATIPAFSPPSTTTITNPAP